MPQNPKNVLIEALVVLGWGHDLLRYRFDRLGPSGPWSAEACVTFPAGPIVHGVGVGSNTTEATVVACADILRRVAAEHPDLLVDWQGWLLEAQHGDKLIKAASRLRAPNQSGAQNSFFLQRYESDAHLSAVYGEWATAGDADVLRFGPGLGRKRRATVVEALLWRRYGPTLSEESARELLRAIGAPTE